MVFKIVGGLHGSEVWDAYDSRLPIAEYVRAALQVSVSDEHKGHYKNRLATDWAWGHFIPSQVSTAKLVQLWISGNFRGFRLRPEARRFVRQTGGFPFHVRNFDANFLGVIVSFSIIILFLTF